MVHVSAPQLPLLNLADAKSAVSPPGSPCRRVANGMQERLAARIGDIPARSRYHRLPRRVTDDYEVSSKVLGRGATGEVFLGHSRAGRRRVAVKVIGVDNLSKAAMEQLEAEVEIFLTMDHPYVTRLYDVYRSPGKMHLVMECMEGGDLLDRVKDAGVFTEAQAREAIGQMLRAVNHCHSRGIVHRDIKLEHFMYPSPGSSRMKLIDFGFSCLWDASEGKNMDVRCGTPSYCAPEVWNRNYTSQCDMWSLGVCSYVLMKGQMPFPRAANGLPVMSLMVQEAQRMPEKMEGHSADAVDFVSSLFQLEPDMRPTAQEAMQHPFIKRERGGNSPKGVADALRCFANVSKFRRCCMHVMARSVSSTDAQALEEAFVAMDASGRGVVTPNDVRRVLAEDGDVDESEVQQIFEALDQNNDQEVQFSDFLAAMVHTEIALSDDLISCTFQKFDSPRKGYISKKGFSSVMGDSFEGECVEDLVEEVGARQANLISLAEFSSFLRGHRSAETGSEGSGQSSGSSMSSRFKQAFARMAKLRCGGGF